MTSKGYIGLGSWSKTGDPLNDGYKIELEPRLHIWTHFLSMVVCRVQLCDIVLSHHLHIDIRDLAKYQLT